GGDPDRRGPPEEQYRKERRAGGLPQCGGNGQGEHETRKREEDVREPEDHDREDTSDRPRSVPISGDEPKAPADEEGKQRDREPNREIEGQGCEDPREHVPTEVVGAEEMLGGRG